MNVNKPTYPSTPNPTIDKSKEPRPRTIKIKAANQHKGIWNIIKKWLQSIIDRIWKPKNTTEAIYLDKNRLLKSSYDGGPIHPSHRDWFLNQALLLSHSNCKDPEIQERINLALLQSHSKAAPYHLKTINQLDIQTSPLLSTDISYHRNVDNRLLRMIRKDYAAELAMDLQTVHLVSNSSVKPLLYNHLTKMPEDLKETPDTEEKFEQLMDRLIQAYKNGTISDGTNLIDISALLPSTKDPKKISAAIKKLRDIGLKKIGQNLNFVQRRGLISSLQLVAVAKYKGTNLLLMPPFSKVNSSFQKKAAKLLANSGFLISPDEAKKAWLRLRSVKAILEQFKLPLAELATGGSTIPKVCENYQAFLENPQVKKFQKLSLTEETPYLKILPKATVHLLEGFAKISSQGGIDQFYRKHGLEDLLQISYFRILNAMSEAALRKDDLFAFNNQLEIIHNEIQSILTIYQPYHPDDFAKIIIEKWRAGENPMIPKEVDSPLVSLRSSAMNCVSGIVQGVKSQKGGAPLNIATLKDSYYESVHLIQKSLADQTYTLNGDRFNEEEKIEKAFDKPPKEPIDLFLCEFRHNISLDRQVYQKEKIIQQIKALIEKGMAAPKFTVAIDATLSLEQSEELKSLLADKQIQNYIQEGRLNLVVFRSAQKFDMLGMDNYYGGVEIAFNKRGDFEPFNTAMIDPNSQLQGLSYQGLAHLHKNAGSDLDQYRQGIIDNTTRLYRSLPQKMFSADNPIQVSKNLEDQIFYIDIKHQNSAIKKAFGTAFRRISGSRDFGFTQRASFGFSNINFIVIQDKTRLTMGLNNQKTIDFYISFFAELQKAIDVDTSFRSTLPNRISNVGLDEP